MQFLIPRITINAKYFFLDQVKSSSNKKSVRYLLRDRLQISPLMLSELSELLKGCVRYIFAGLFRKSKR